MEVLFIVVGIVLVAAILYGLWSAAIVGFAWALAITAAFWPVIVGLGIGVVLGTMGYTSIGVAVALGGIGGQFAWNRKLGESGSTGGGSSARRTLYDKEGNPIGYVDED